MCYYAGDDGDSCDDSGGDDEGAVSVVALVALVALVAGDVDDGVVVLVLRVLLLVF